MDNHLFVKGESILFQLTYVACFTSICAVLLNRLLNIRWPDIPFQKICFLSTLKGFSASPEIIGTEHETARYLQELIEVDGAGSWPPRASFGASWPAALRPYHDIYNELCGSLACKEASLDDQENMKKINSFRARMQKLLKERINLSTVEGILLALEEGDIHVLSLENLNGFFACISMSRHAYRWCTVPVVAAAQKETVVKFPKELDVPWSYLARRFGVTSPGGNIASNNLCNFDCNDKQVYHINSLMSEEIRTTEYNFMFVFSAIERKALPMYHDMVASIIHYENGQKEECLKSLRKVTEQLRIPLQHYHQTLSETKISRAVWMPYVQGILGWACGQIENGVYVEYDGLSGNQLPMPFFIDAFLGYSPYLPEENMLRYIPASQRKLRQSFSDHSFREKAKLNGDIEIEEEMLKIVKQMRVFRAGHRVRVMPYLDIPAPERLIMTAGKSVMENDEIQNIGQAVESLDAMLEKRFKETV